MRIALKFILTMILILIVIRSIEGVLTVQRETYRLDAAIQRDARFLGRILAASVGGIWAESGRERALELVDGLNVEDHPVHISWVPYEGRNGLRNRLDEESLSGLQSGNMVNVRQHDSEMGELHYSYVPLDAPDAGGAIQLAETLEDRSRYVRHGLVREVIVGSIVIVAGGGAMLLLGFVVIGRPLSQLRERINRIGDGNLSERIMLRGYDELSTLADGLNDMCEKLSSSRERELAETQKRLEALEQMRHMDRLTTIGRLASGVAHELGTPLNVIAGRADMLCDGTIPPELGHVRRIAGTIGDQADRMTNIIRRLLDFARQRPPRRVETNGLDIVRQAIELVECLGYKATARLETRGEASSLIAEMDPVQMQQVLTNLIENALQAMPDGGDATVSVRSAPAEPLPGIDAPARRFLQIAVKDEGCGIAEADLPNIFDPFFTTKDVGEGTGLGLSIAYGIVREHGGWIDVSSESGRGSLFTVYIPQENLQ